MHFLTVFNACENATATFDFINKFRWVLKKYEVSHPELEVLMTFFTQNNTPLAPGLLYHSSQDYNPAEIELRYMPVHMSLVWTWYNRVIIASKVKFTGSWPENIHHDSPGW